MQCVEDMPRKHRANASRARSAAIPPTAPPVERPRDLADRRDRPAPDHANLGPDDRASTHLDDIESEGAERVHDVDVSVIEGGTSEVELH